MDDDKLYEFLDRAEDFAGSGNIEEAMSGLRQIVSTCPTHGANLMLIRLLIRNA